MCYAVRPRMGPGTMAKQQLLAHPLCQFGLERGIVMPRGNSRLATSAIALPAIGDDYELASL